MIWIYSIGISLYSVIIKIASYFNNKARLFIVGRKNIFEELKIRVNANDRPIWFHFASLGEFEQGRPVLEKVKSLYPEVKILITFFSPSGYEIRKNYPGADAVFYLPIDRARNAKKFVDLVNPRMAIFTKYEFWFHYFKTLHSREIPLYMISAIFRPNQIFFKWYGGFNRKILSFVTHFFVQNDESAQLLKQIDLLNVTVNGDTRFDRVYENSLKTPTNEFVARFCSDSPTFIVGSSWPEDEKLLPALSEKYPDWKIIIAPHEVHEKHISDIEILFPNSVKFSVFKNQSSQTTSKILIIDNIGMLSSLYQYASLAYIGGGFGAGIHNTLEAAAFKLPIIFGPKYDKFQEAKDLIAIDAARSINNSEELIAAFEYFKNNESAAERAASYVKSNKGATEIILETVFKTQD
ncbi:MAG: 3-deoxy-D-manno-octulosonic acid transferase [Pedobacter sp.]|nr:MAG: 3-deoxy-D-manno-octulosonic acid transferase [Pedobacter sp.]